MTTTTNPLSLFADRLDPPESEYLTRPSAWVADRLGEHLWSKQVAIQDAVVDNRHVAVHSCNDVGKSFSMARLAAWWIEEHDPGEAFVISTAPTWSQVSSILWRELARAHRKGKLRGRITSMCEWKLDMGSGPDELVAYGRKPADYDAQGFLGIHQRYVLVIVDEGCGVPQTIYDAAESLATNEHARIVAVGNPDDPASFFAKICAPGSGWYTIRVDAFESPNFTAAEVNKYPNVRALMIREGIVPSKEEIPNNIRDLLVSPLWVSERMKRWGVGSPMFESRVRGRFPRVTNNTLIHPHWVSLACARELQINKTDQSFGVDVARYGSDHSIIVHRQGGHARVVEDIAYGPVTELAGKIQLLGMMELTTTPVANIDDTGVGGGVTDILKEDRYPCNALISSAACSPDEVLPNGKPKFANARSEWWWRLREWLAGYTGTGDDGRLDLDPDDEDLIAQITTIKYKINSHGQIQVESKDDMRSRHLPSPDRGDALVYSLVSTRAQNVVPLISEMITGDVYDKIW
jgi:hypothetical protein